VPSSADPPAPGSVFWLEQALALDPGEACPPLSGPLRVDVCIVGGGFTGLWTALELTSREPGLRVALLESEICGAGASGRNGGWAMSWHDEADTLLGRFGRDQARWLVEEAAGAVDRIGTFAAEHGIDCYYRHGGVLWAAAAPAQVGAWRPAQRACEELGVGGIEELSGEELRRRTGCPLLLGGAYLRAGATVQPALLVRGLRRVALERGVRIFEATPMRRLERGPTPRVVTPGGVVEADRVVVALGAWSAALRELRRAIVPVGSHIVLTEPVPDRIQQLGWTGGEALGDARLLVHYAHVTRDGRIAFGRGGGAIGPAGRVTAAHHRDPRAVRQVAADFRRFFPDLADVRLTHAWGGPVDRAPQHLPFAGTVGDHGSIAYAAGFSGNGVAPSALLARVLASLTLGSRDEYAISALASGPPAYLPPEPLRALGGALVRGAVARAEAAEERGAKPNRVDSALRRLVWATTPSALEPRLRRPPPTR
jgi:glycine/D-amino acid oxidase-like deaminating enzyme